MTYKQVKFRSREDGRLRCGMVLVLLVVLCGGRAELAAQHSSARGNAKPVPVGNYEILHRTEYRYDKPVRFQPHTLRLLPQVTSGNPAPRIRKQELSIAGVEYQMVQQLDLEGNAIVVAEFGRGPTQTLTVEVRLWVELPRAAPPLDPPPAAPPAVKLPLVYGWAEPMLAPFRRMPPEPPDAGLRAFLEQCPETADDAGEWLTDLTVRTYRAVRHSARVQPGVRSPEQTLRDGGACRDVAGLMIDVLRRRGWAARWVSGYLLPDAALFGKGDRSHPADLHAWVEVYFPGAGWVGVDGTYGRTVDARYVPLARSSDWAGTLPVEGAFVWADFARTGAGRDQLTTQVTVRRLPGQ